MHSDGVSRKLLKEVHIFNVESRACIRIGYMVSDSFSVKVKVGLDYLMCIWIGQSERCRQEYFEKEHSRWFLVRKNRT